MNSRDIALTLRKRKILSQANSGSVVAWQSAKIKELQAALRPFVSCVFDDNGDVTIDQSQLKRSDWLKARIALKQKEGQGDV